jgi:hypothetical protein
MKIQILREAIRISCPLEAVHEMIDALNGCFDETTSGDFMQGRTGLLELMNYLCTVAERESHFHRVCLTCKNFAKYRRWKEIYEFVGSPPIEIMPRLITPNQSVQSPLEHSQPDEV